MVNGLCARGVGGVDQGAHGDEVIGAGADVELADIVGRRAILLVGLYEDAVGAPLQVEVVNVARAEVGLQRTENIADIDIE